MTAVLEPDNNNNNNNQTPPQLTGFDSVEQFLAKVQKAKAADLMKPDGSVETEIRNKAFRGFVEGIFNKLRAEGVLRLEDNEYASLINLLIQFNETSWKMGFNAAKSTYGDQTTRDNI